MLFSKGVGVLVGEIAAVFCCVFPAESSPKSSQAGALNRPMGPEDYKKVDETLQCYMKAGHFEDVTEPLAADCAFLGQSTCFLFLLLPWSRPSKKISHFKMASVKFNDMPVSIMCFILIVMTYMVHWELKNNYLFTYSWYPAFPWLAKAFLSDLLSTQASGA